MVTRQRLGSPGTRTDEMTDLDRIEKAMRNCFAQFAHYYTDGGIHFYANPSYRKMKGLTYVGSFHNAKEAREFYYSPPEAYLRRSHKP